MCAHVSEVLQILDLVPPCLEIGLLHQHRHELDEKNLAKMSEIKVGSNVCKPLKAIDFLSVYLRVCAQDERNYLDRFIVDISSNDNKLSAVWNVLPCIPMMITVILLFK